MDAFDVVRALYEAVNRADLEAIAAIYSPDCIVEHVFAGDDGVYTGRQAAAERWAREFATFAGALPGGHRVDVLQVAGIETGWGWARAEWVRQLRATATGVARTDTGYSHFWVEDGLIRRHRSVAKPTTPGVVSGAINSETTPGVVGDRFRDRRHYPERPIVGVGAVIFDVAGRVVLVKRKHEPLAGQWSLPGGGLEVGETLEAGTRREILEETGLVVDVGPVVEVFDRILVDETGRVRYHFVLVDYLCRPRGGVLAAGSDVADVALADPRALGPYRVTEKAQAVVERALSMTGDRGVPS